MIEIVVVASACAALIFFVTTTSGVACPKLIGRKICDLFNDVNAVKSIVFNIVVVTLTLGVYYSVGYFTNLKYLRWAESLDNIELADGQKLSSISNNPLKEPLPDLFLDHVLPESWNTINAVSYIADLVPSICLVVAFSFCFLQRYIDLSNHCIMMFFILIVTNGIAENVTVMPSSYGYERCIEFLGLEDFDAPKSDHYAFSFQMTGACTAMMWSGHTQQTMLGTYTFLSGLERRWPKTWRKKIGKEYSSMSMKTLIVCGAALFEATVLLCNSAHYMVDIWVGFMITALFISHDQIKYWCTIMNPFIREHNVFTTRLEKVQHLDFVMAILKEEHPRIHNDVVAKLSKVHPKALVEDSDSPAETVTTVYGSISSSDLSPSTRDELEERV
eukprot:GEMP01017851.1.p1 GENE.GEMP01017851.1~~GEMP01017851.1.p1  ORF type:complete len:388 (+),score=52.09 GEMP01017851.1:100-1263(+)